MCSPASPLRLDLQDADRSNQMQFKLGGDVNTMYQYEGVDYHGKANVADKFFLDVGKRGRARTEDGYFRDSGRGRPGWVQSVYDEAP